MLWFARVRSSMTKSDILLSSCPKSPKHVVWTFDLSPESYFRSLRAWAGLHKLPSSSLSLSLCHSRLCPALRAQPQVPLIQMLSCGPPRAVVTATSCSPKNVRIGFLYERCSLATHVHSANGKFCSISSTSNALNAEPVAEADGWRPCSKHRLTPPNAWTGPGSGTGPSRSGKPWP